MVEEFAEGEKVGVMIPNQQHKCYEFALATIKEFDGTTLVEGHIVVLPIGHQNLQFLRLNSTLGGTTPSGTVSAYLVPSSMIDNSKPFEYGIGEKTKRGRKRKSRRKSRLRKRR